MRNKVIQSGLKVGLKVRPILMGFGLVLAQGALSMGSRKTSQPLEQPSQKTDKPDTSTKLKDQAEANVEAQYLISFQESLPSEQRDAILKEHSAITIQKIGTSELYLIEFQPGTKDHHKDLSKKLGQAPGVRYVEPNVKYRTFK